MGSPQEIVQIVDAVVEARKRIDRSKYGDTTFFSLSDYWEYFGLGDPDSECETCLKYDGKTFTGDQLRGVFPDLRIEGPDDIYPNVHMTLWGKDTCKCKLVRLNIDKVDTGRLDWYLEW